MRKKLQELDHKKRYTFTGFVERPGKKRENNHWKPTLILKAKTDVEEVTYYLYDYHDKECFISKEDPNYRKYFDAIANANLKYQSDNLEITTTTTTLAPGYDS